MKLQLKTDGLQGDSLEFATKFNGLLATMPEPMGKEDTESAISKALGQVFGTKEGGELNVEFIQTVKDMNDSTKEGSVKSILAKQGTAINDILGKLNVSSPEGNLEQFKKDFEAAKGDLENIKRDGSGAKSFVIKVAAVTTTSSSITNSVTSAASQRLGDGPVFELQRGLPFILNFVTVGNTDASALVWFDELPKEGDFAITAEGTIKPLVQYKFEKKTASYKKVAGRAVITEEFDMDYPRLVSKIRELMQIDCRNAMNAIILTDMIANASAYAYNGLDDQIATPDNYAAIGAAISQLQSLYYTPTVLVLNPADAWAMRLTKDLEGRYQMSPLTMPNGTTYEFGNIIVDPRVPVGNFFVGDGSVYHVDLRGDIIIRMGYGTGDFEANQYTLLVEQYFYNYISTARKPGFIYANFAVVKADIAA